MTKLALLGLVLPAAGLLASAIGPAGSSVSQGCGPRVEIQDPELRARFARFDARQSSTATKICEIYRESAEF